MSAPDTVAKPLPAAATPRPGGSWLATQGRLPLAYMALGLCWFAAATAGTVLAPELLATAHTAPAVIALTHAWVLGFFVTVAVGAIYQLAPVALSTTLSSDRAGWWHLWLHAAAVPAMVYAFYHFNLRLLGAAALVLLLGILLFAANTWVTVFRSGKRDCVAWSLALATGWLVATVLAGLFLVGNRLWVWWPTDPVPLLRAHAHVGLVGFFLTLLQGVSFRLVPMFTLGDVPDWRPVRVGLWCSQLGLVVLTPALAFHAGLLASIAAGAIIVGAAISGWALKCTFATRKKRHLDAGLKALVRGCAVSGVAALVGFWLVLPNTSGGSAPGGVSANVYGVLVFFGGLLPAIAGMMNKIVPFLTWMRAYGPKVGRAPTPPATALANAELEVAALAVQGAAVLPLLVGAWTTNRTLLALGALGLAVGTGLFLANMAIVLRHLWRPVTLSFPLPQRAPA